MSVNRYRVLFNGAEKYGTHDFVLASHYDAALARIALLEAALHKAIYYIDQDGDVLPEFMAELRSAFWPTPTAQASDGAAASEEAKHGV